ncbi:hypothetical protein A2661_02955 [Candidatus Giovannonibacteria bacterium RIFCSPHIGHO2_01_FULL_45_24]|uniref:Uncharacterized protein n=1 Tax=Candidatus Giovannonibacteria bacterium RIFCSPLOWO2_01_FULL_46_32 TaxID=1798353 RepID=A0A1F5XHL3_9BACT|nr:MAG: hypothetical protein A2661_02955 [Candidatus Giovannonibacteria bacterium RIFCSPHIGHO2_01_FULL_45_24]OGF86971.1 MAG: hypothetical protein A3B19_00875 [Candidatus Giovannonibacteria bacterium RIFCSPLOWO2_01_FULL_46_32]
MVTSRKGSQLWLLDFKDVVQKPEELAVNLAILKEWRRNASFKIELSEEHFRAWLRYVHTQNGNDHTTPWPNNGQWLFEWIALALPQKDAAAPFFLRCRCGLPPVFFKKCACGKLNWCQHHLDSDVMYDHLDHECSLWCCEHLHANRNREKKTWTAAEISELVEKLKITLAEPQAINGAVILQVECRQHSGNLEFASALMWFKKNARVAD